MISHYRLVSSQSTGGGCHPLVKDVSGFLQALLSCVQSCPGRRGVPSQVQRQLALIPGEVTVCILWVDGNGEGRLFSKLVSVDGWVLAALSR